MVSHAVCALEWGQQIVSLQLPYVINSADSSELSGRTALLYALAFVINSADRSCFRGELPSCALCLLFLDICDMHIWRFRNI